MGAYHIFPRNNGKSVMQNFIANLKSSIYNPQDSTKPLDDTVDIFKSGIETFMNSLGIKDGVNTPKPHDDSCDALLYAVQYTNSDASPLYINTEKKSIKDDLYYG